MYRGINSVLLCNIREMSDNQIIHVEEIVVKYTHMYA